ncbi:formylglycine-generating enzyme family protein [Phaeodactylibacter xiamenensis]|uniref:formylglycine-generating enzyme family protein n=1 Tax=Phaeodactylibacter xiamenensis TaxID=1524460 RepID=UPI0024A9D402|nr:formylglycine-generating enzyme family protein [Phaeodactylibacter xiamenensis]
MKHLLFILMLLQPMLLNAQKSALEDYFKSYFAILNNLGDVRNSIEDRNLFQTFILDQYFMPGEESLVYNHLRPTGTRIIKAQEYLDIIITDFPEGVEFRFDSLEVVDFQMGSKFSEATVHVMFQVTPNKEEIAQPPLSFLLQVSGMSTSRISGRIKSIDRIPKPIEEPMVPILDLEDITIASQPTEPVQETATYPEATLDTSFNTTEVNKYLPKVIQDLERSMVFVEGGRFQMGCTEEQGKECKYIEKPAHWVELNSFYIGKFEVSQAQWEAITSSNPSRNRECEYCPVENVNWNEVNAFIKDLNKLTDKKYRLPTDNSPWGK